MILLARRFRREMTGVELIAWAQLRRGQINGARFRRQRPIGPYIVDFVCLSEKLVVEIDGPGHDRTSGQDRRRTDYLKGFGYRVLRFTADDILRDREVVWNSVAAELAAPGSVIE